MIHLEVLSSSDPLAIGLYEFAFDQLFIGRSKKNDLIFLEPELPLNYISLQITEDLHTSFLIIRSVPHSPFFFINGKKVSGTLKIYTGDIISIGENKLQIVNFKKTWAETDLSEAYSQFSANAPDLRFALDFIEEVLIDLEEKGQNV